MRKGKRGIHIGKVSLIYKDKKQVVYIDGTYNILDRKGVESSENLWWENRSKQ